MDSTLRSILNSLVIMICSISLILCSRAIYRALQLKAVRIISHHTICTLRTSLCQTHYRISRPIRRTMIFSLEILEKNNDECILILVIYWKKIGLLHTKISNHNIIYSSQKPRKSLSLPLKSSSWLFSLSHDKDVV